MEVAQLMLALPRRCPRLEVEALDSEQFFGVTMKELDAMAAAEEAAAQQAAAGVGAHAAAAAGPADMES